MPIEWVLTEIFINTVEVSALFYLFCNKFTAKYRNFLPTLLFAAGNIFLISLPAFISLEYLTAVEVLMPVICFIYLMIFRTGNNLKKVFWTFISFAIIFSVSIFTVTVIAIIGGKETADIITQVSSERLLSLIIAKSLQVVIFYILAKRERRFESAHVSHAMPLTICFIVPLISFAILLYIFILTNSHYSIPENLISAVSVSFLAINITVFILYELISIESEKTYMLVARNKQYELTEQHNSQVIEIYDKMREWRHDYNNHMQLILGMLEKTGSGGGDIIDYIKNLDEKIKSASLEIVTGNHIIDAILSAKAALASSHAIEFEHNISLTGGLSVEDTDLCSILSNLLDNAIEACCKVEQNRYISLEMLIFKNQLSINISNSADGRYITENGKLKTTKLGDMHGIGIGHIKSIVENYGGILDIKPEADAFTARVSIPLKSA